MTDFYTFFFSLRNMCNITNTQGSLWLYTTPDSPYSKPVKHINKLLRCNVLMYYYYMLILRTADTWILTVHDVRLQCVSRERSKGIMQTIYKYYTYSQITMNRMNCRSILVFNSDQIQRTAVNHSFSVIFFEVHTKIQIKNIL